jgi:hypothetical protein
MGGIKKRLHLKRGKNNARVGKHHSFRDGVKSSSFLKRNFYVLNPYLIDQEKSKLMNKRLK